MSIREYNFISLSSFNEAVEQWKNGSMNRKILTRSDYNDIKTTLQGSNTQKNANQRYNIRSKFVLQKIGDNEIVMCICKNRTKKNDDNLKPLLVKEELYQVFCKAHLQNNHGGQNQTWNNIKKTWGGVKQDLIELLVKRCLTCSSRNNVRQLTVAGKPIIANSFMSRLQVINFNDFCVSFY